MDPAPLFDAIARAPAGGRAFWLRAADGVRIRLAAWQGPEAARGTVFLLPGRTEYIEKYGPAAGEFAARGYAMISVDWRGQGLADRLVADPAKGHVSRYPEYQLDFDAVLRCVETLGLPRPWFVLGHSMGGAIGLRRLMDTNPFAAAAFSAPMWGIRLPLPPLSRAIARTLERVGLDEIYVPTTSPETYVLRTAFNRNRLTTDPAMWAFMIEQVAAEPELTIAGPTIRWLTQSLHECAALAALPAPDLPCYCALGGLEKIVEIGSVHRRMAGWPRGRLEIITGAEHELMMETPPARARFYDACAALFDAAPR
jgi:lysophospholipase